MSADDDIMRERAAVNRLYAAIDLIEGDLDWYWHWNDGQGGFVLEELRAAVIRKGHRWPFDPSGARVRKRRRSARTCPAA